MEDLEDSSYLNFLRSKSDIDNKSDLGEYPRTKLSQNQNKDLAFLGDKYPAVLGDKYLGFLGDKYPEFLGDKDQTFLGDKYRGFFRDNYLEFLVEIFETKFHKKKKNPTTKNLGIENPIKNQGKDSMILGKNLRI